MASIPEIASQLVEHAVSKDNGENAKTIIFVGSKAVGKSTLLYSFLDKNDTPRETLVLEYMFGRKSNQKQSMEKSVCHVWEYGGKLELLKSVLKTIPLRGKIFYCIMVDLSKIKTIWPCLEICLEALKEIENVGEDIQVIIIGGKYDLFKNYDSEIKKIICTTLRSIAIIKNAHLYFYTSKEQAIARKIKDVLYNFGFKNEYNFKDKCTNYTKPLFIPQNVDSWEHIGLSSMTLEEVKMKHVTRISSDPEVSPINQCGGPQRTHAEPSLDLLAKNKYDEIRKLVVGLDLSIDDYLNNLS